MIFKRVFLFYFSVFNKKKPFKKTPSLLETSQVENVNITYLLL